MKHSTKVLFVALVVFLLAPALASAAVLGSLDMSGGVATAGSFPPQLWIRLAIASDPAWACWTNSPPFCDEIWSRTLTPADIGSTFVVNSTNNVEFPGLAALLTNGMDNWLSTSGRLTGPVADPGGAFALQESYFFAGGGPDFKGSTVTEVDITLRNLTFGTMMLPGPPSSTSLIPYTQGIADLTITVIGDPVAIPEVSPLLSTALGLLLTCGGVVVRSRRRWRQSDA